MADVHSVHRRLQWITLAAMIAMPCDFAQGEEPTEWGNLQGKFVWQGKLPKIEFHKITKDVKHMPKQVRDESLLVDPKTRGIANVYVYLVPTRNNQLKMHPDYTQDELPTIRVRFTEGRITPHAILLRAGQQLEYIPEDAVGHIPMVQLKKRPAPGVTALLSLGFAASFSEPELEPGYLSCNVHPWMNSLLLIRDNPYMALSDSTGAFTIQNIPVGEHRFYLWHEKAEWLDDIQFGGYRTTRSGQVTVKIKPGDNDWGSISLRSDDFAR